MRSRSQRPQGTSAQGQVHNPLGGARCAASGRRAGALLGAGGLTLGLLGAACQESEAGSGIGLKFSDVAPELGIDVEIVSGDPRRWYIPESNGSGAAWLDYDGDGDQDLFVGNGRRLRYVDDGKTLEQLEGPTGRLYRNDLRGKDGTGKLGFTDVSNATGMARTEWVNAVTVGDVDNDGDPDVYLGCFGTDVLLTFGWGKFTELGPAKLPANVDWAAGAAFGDADRDGNLDLYVANYVAFDLDAPPLGGKRMVYEGVELGWGPEEENGQGFNLGAPDRFYLGDGQGGFVEATAERGLALDKPLCSYAVVFSDVDLDGYQDILVANDLQPSNLFHNKGDGFFAEEGLERGFALSSDGKATAGMGLAFADVDDDGDFDCLRTNFDFEANALLLNDGTGRFRDAAGPWGLAEESADQLGWAAAFFDAELDGDLDLVVANGHVLPQAEEVGMHPWAMPTQLFLHEGAREASSGAASANDSGDAGRRRGARYREVGVEAGFAGAYAARGIALGDPDEDGDVDVLVVDIDGPPRLMLNASRRRGRWIAVALEGRQSNRDGLGARVEVETDDGRRRVHEVRRTNGLYSSHDVRAHFGLGEVGSVRAVEVVWPNGVRQRIDAPPLDEVLTIREPMRVDD